MTIVEIIVNVLSYLISIEPILRVVNLAFSLGTIAIKILKWISNGIIKIFKALRNRKGMKRSIRQAYKKRVMQTNNKLNKIAV